jgi:hypothetical protein
VHWDGEKWELKRINGHGSEITVILAFSPTDIWYNGLLHWNGSIYELRNKNFPLLPNGYGWVMNKMWGTSSGDLYVVGDKGMIAHYDGHSWTKVESGTDIRLTDIWGSPDGSVVWVCGFDDVKGSVLLRKASTNFEKIVEVTSVPANPQINFIEYVFESVWTNTVDSVYIASNGRVYHAKVSTTGEAQASFWWDYAAEQGFPPATHGIRGNHYNDLFTCGEYGNINHWNGQTWKTYTGLPEFSINFSLSVKDSIVTAVGVTENWTGFIALGKR